MRILVFITCFFTLSNLQSQVQPELLLDNTYNSFSYDSKQNLWISSQGGWNRYDGINTKYYVVNDSLSGLKGEWIQSSFFPDSQDRLWTCTFDHLCYYTVESDRFTCFQVNLNGKRVVEDYRVIGVDKIDDKPLLRAGNQFCKYDIDEDELHSISSDAFTNSILAKFFQDTILAYEGIQNSTFEIWDRTEEDWNKVIFDFSNCDELEETYISDSEMLADDIWLASSKGLLLFDRQNYCNSKLFTFRNREFKAYHLVIKDGVIFISTDLFGVLAFDTRVREWVEIINTNHKTIPLDRNNPIEIFDTGESLMISYRRSDPQFINWSDIIPLVKLHMQVELNFIPEIIYGNGTYQVLASKKGNLEIYRNGIEYSTININASAAVRNIHIDNNTLYFHDESSLYQYDLDKKQISRSYKNKAQALQEVFYYLDRKYAIIGNQVFEIKGRSLVAVISEELNKDIIAYHRLSDSSFFISQFNKGIFISQKDTIEIPTQSYIYDVSFDEAGQKLLLALGKGLGIYDSIKDTFQIVSVNEAIVNKIYAFDDNTVLLTTSKGVFSYLNDEVEKLPSSNSNIKLLVKDHDLIYTVGEEGLESFNIETIQNDIPLELSIRDESHLGNIKDDVLNYHYSYDDPPLSFSVHTDSYVANEDGKCSYRVEGYNYSFDDISYGETIRLPPLAPGIYKVHIEAKDEYQKIIQELEFIVEVSGPLWTRGWFLLSIFIFTILLCWAYFKIKSTRLKKDLAISEELNKLEKSALQAQMNPHFIFNCLNSIQNFIMENDKHNAMEYLGQFAKLIRLNLKASVEDKITLYDEISMLTNYLTLEQLRLNNKFTFFIESEKSQDLDETLIPPMLIQPFVENAVIHGMKSIEEKGEIKISFKLDNGFLKVIIMDNGLSNYTENKKSDPSRKSYGISITKKRLEHINKDIRSTINVSNTQSHTIISINILL